MAVQLHDYDLTVRDITALETSEQVVRLFALLGYNVDHSQRLTHASLGMDTEDLQQRVRKITRIAADPDDEIQIILFEVRSVTVALTHAIAQRFRQRPGNYLLVLTDDYETLDFVLLERIKTEGKGTGGLPRYVIRPRILTVNRRNPGIVALRVLKRFTFTEADALYQWDKLRSAYSLAEWSEPDFNNRALFSDYYLKHRVTDRDLNPSWQEDVRGVGGESRRLMAGARERLTKENEQRTRATLIEPLLALMGFEFVANKPGSSSAEEPDYILYAPGHRDKPIALALTYKWNRNLDSADPERDRETPDENPGALIVTLLEKGDVPWVIMTNGKLWRLYSATASNKITNYYEIDLEEALFAPDIDRETAFKYWWLMFRREAFTGFLDKVLAESQEYAKKIREALKDRIFKHIFGYFAGGFIDYMRQQGLDDDQIDLDLVFNATMTFLYRLMFVLYAESLELVPVKEENGYGLHSVKTLKGEIAAIAGKILDQADDRLRDHYDADSTALYERLRRLFHSIDQGDPDINLPVYNGGLFSTESRSGAFLEQYAIPDVYLAIGLDQLARDVDDKTHELVFIDFKSLGVRQLGSIYEGLLEFKLRIAREKLAVIRDGKREVYMPHAKAVKEKKHILDTIQPGQVYIENTKQERKATGSYYTPDYIVKYIVQHTVGPVLEEKFAALRQRLNEAQKLYRQHKATVEARHDSQSAELFWLRPEMQQLADDCLNVRVLDPAMGSGHFLVEAVDYISNRLIDFLNGWSENPVWALLERTRADILAEMERQGVSIDESKLTRVVLLKRSVLKRCVYGVDLNPMAVELAKVSLWLDAFTLGAPLSFLDHHLKWGNSLIGARIAEVQDYLAARAGETIDMFSGSKFAGVMLATDLMRQVSYLSDNTIEQTRRSAQAYRDASDHLAPYKRVLDVYTSRWFGNPMPKPGKTDNVRLFLQDPQVEAWLHDPSTPLSNALIPAQQIAQTALRAAEEKRFFHWELEFPEVFFAPSTPGGQDVQLRKDGGFDAVVGNPPYLRVHSLDEASANYSSKAFSTAVGSYDVYSLFIERGFTLLNPDGYQGYIVPHKFFEAQYGQPLRELLSKTQSLAEIVHFGDQQVFESATTYTCIIVLSKRGQAEFKFTSVDNLVNWRTDYKAEAVGTVLSENVSGADWNFVVGPDAKIFAILDALPNRIKHMVDNISQGIRTSANQIYVVRILDDRHSEFLTVESQIESESFEIERGAIRYFLMGREIKSYEIIESSLAVIVPYSLDPTGRAKLFSASDFKSKYPKAFAYLQRHKNELESRENGRMRGDKWYGYVYPKNLEVMLSTKILVPDIADHASFALDNAGKYAFTSGYGIILKPNIPESYTFILAILNSALLDFYWKKVSTTIRGGYFRYFTQYIEQLPIPRISFTTPAERRAALAEQGRDLYARSLSDGPAAVLAFTAQRLDQDETDVIHDLLAFLAQQMIDLNKQKQAEVRRFLGWLEEVLWPPHPLSPSPTAARGEGERRGVGEGRREGEETRWEVSPELEKRMVEIARRLRQDSTPSEDLLWQAVRSRQLEGRKFRRQQPVGPFVLDFYCAEERLAVEVDGPVHDTQREADQARQELLEELGIRFVRVTADQVENDLPAVLDAIRAAFLPSPLVGEGPGVRGKIASLTGRTFIQNYLGDYQKGEPELAFEDFYFRLHQNRGRFGVPLASIKAELEDAYRESLDVLLPIKRQLAHTDALIDRIVYQLYGLTEDEIRLIEYPALEQAVSTAREDVLKEKEIAPGSDEAIEKIAEKVEQAAVPYFARVDEAEIEARLRAELPGWDTFSAKVRTFLITGELLLERNNLPEYSGVVISFGKAAETLLNERIFIPFRESHRPEDCQNDFLRKFMRSKKTLSLGSMPIVLASSDEVALRRFVLERYPDAGRTILAQDGLLALLAQDRIDVYRNGAAHDAELQLDDARAARAWALEIVGYV